MRELAAAALLAAWIGCPSAKPPPPPAAPAYQVQSTVNAAAVGKKAPL